MPMTGTLLNNVSTTGTGAVVTFDKPKSKFDFVTSWTGNNASASNIEIDASIDGGSTYYLYYNLSFGTSAPPSPINSFQTAQGLVTSIRANLNTLQSGVTNVTLEFAAED